MLVFPLVVELIQGFYFRHSDPSVKSWVVLVSTNEILGAQNCDPLNILNLTFSALKIGSWYISSLSFWLLAYFQEQACSLSEGGVVFETGNLTQPWQWNTMLSYEKSWANRISISFYSHECREFFEFLGPQWVCQSMGWVPSWKYDFNQAPNSFSLLQNCSSLIFGPVSTHGCFQK